MSMTLMKFNTCCLMMLCGLAQALHAAEPCTIRVIEKGTNWPVCLVELRTTDHQRFVTDNAGVIALDAPEMMNRETWFTVQGQGYGIPADGFGMQGVRLTPQPGKTLTVEVERKILAKRLGRITGAGLFAESQKLGQELDWRESGIVGADSVQNAVHRGKLYWAWGDTTLAKYPLGIFDGTSATTAVQPLKNFEPPLRMPLDYIVDDKDRPRGVAKMPGSGPTWINGYVSLRDKDGVEHLVCSYNKIKGHLEAYEWSQAVWNEKTQTFDKLRTVWTKSAEQPKQPLVPEGHPVFWKDEQGKEWLLFGNPLPTIRMPATFEAWQDPATWEKLTPQDSLADAARNEQSNSGKERIKPHTGSIAWNAWRKRWVTVFMQNYGKPSVFGELWYAEADAPTGPWGPAVKVLSHDNYTFYNPRLHPEMTPSDSPILLFEGTFTREFSNNKESVPRYDYNQILYRLDLDQAGLKATHER
jgi:hypothetical protein